MAVVDPIANFFVKYPGFDYDSSKSFAQEFERLATVRNWGKNGKTRARAYNQLKIAATDQFNVKYGTNVDDINVWQSLCVLLEIDPIPETLKECRKKVKAVFVNIVDLVDATISGTPVRKFPTERALSKYTMDGKIFPLDRAKAGGVLRYLLRQIISPRSGSNRRTQRGLHQKKRRT